MTLLGVVLLALGLAASWVAGRNLDRGASSVQLGAIILCGLGAYFFGMPELVASSTIWAYGVILVFAFVGALLFWAGQTRRKKEKA